MFVECCMKQSPLFSSVLEWHEKKKKQSPLFLLSFIPMRYIRTNSLKRLFSLRRRGSGEQVQSSSCSTGGENNEGFVILRNEECSQRPSWKCFSYEELFDATNGFISENLVGKGGYAEVYRGTLKDDEEIAVKRLTRTCRDERKEKEFLTEIGTIGHVNHSNVLPLLGCCIDNGLYLVFELSTKGSVASLLHDEKLPPVDWRTRHKIVLGTARGLHYLHKGCKRRIIHRDIKASNILLTEDFEPQISDFGLAKWLPSQWTHHSIAPIEGTFGHLAPEYYLHGVVDEKTDVFAFGVFLLEVISGRKPVDGSHQSLHSWAKPILKKGEIEKLVDPRLEGEYDVTELKILAFAASLCIRASSTWRPTMSEVLEVKWRRVRLRKRSGKCQRKKKSKRKSFGVLMILNMNMTVPYQCHYLTPLEVLNYDKQKCYKVSDGDIRNKMVYKNFMIVYQAFWLIIGGSCMAKSNRGLAFAKVKEKYHMATAIKI